MSTVRQCWEIYVPTMRNPTATHPARPIRTKFHRVWDKKVMAISSGLTILKPVKGKWISPNQTLFDERMIPVRIIATEEEIHKIIQITINHYDQEAVLCYMVSDKVHLIHKDPIN